ncbi:conserved hypothetical protein [Vibrio phage 150E35-1]|nr:conserved hypothetical protein [Vibrio phage 150E35-1]
MSKVLAITNVSKAVIVLPIKNVGAHQFNPGVVEKFELSTVRNNWQVIIDQMMHVDGKEQVPAFKYNIINPDDEFIDLEPSPAESAPSTEPDIPEMTDSVEVLVDHVPEEAPETTEPAEPTSEELMELPMKELRKVGKKYGVRDNRRDDLVEKIINARGK